MLDKDYRQIAAYAKLHIRVVHHAELIGELLPQLPIESSVLAATYHDPCYLARGRGIAAGRGKSFAPAEFAHGSCTPWPKHAMLRSG